MRIEPISDEVSIVLLGSFNPKIFHPAWLALHHLISVDQAESASIEIVHPDIARFSAAYMAFEVQSNRFQLRCDTVYKDVIRDLVATAFGDLLPHTPVRQMGINRIISFSCGTEEVRNKLGNLLAPKAPWGSWGADIAKTEVDNDIHGGLIRLIMRQQPRPDGMKGHLQADLNPLAKDSSGVLVNINNHFSISDPETAAGCLDAIELLKNRWQDALERSEYIVDGLMKTVEDLK